jgi:hypothetical protein
VDFHAQHAQALLDIPTYPDKITNPKHMAALAAVPRAATKAARVRAVLCAIVANQDTMAPVPVAPNVLNRATFSQTAPKR